MYGIHGKKGNDLRCICMVLNNVNDLRCICMVLNNVNDLRHTTMFYTYACTFIYKPEYSTVIILYISDIIYKYACLFIDHELWWFVNQQHDL